MEIGATDLLVASLLADVDEASMGGGDETRLQLARAALAAIDPDDDAQRALLLLAAFAATSALDFDARNGIAFEVFDAAHRSDDATALAYAATIVETTRVPLETRVSIIGEAIAAADAARDVRLRALALRQSASVALNAGDRRLERRRLAELEAVARESRQNRAANNYFIHLSVSRLLDGDSTGAEHAAEQALDAGAKAGLPEAMAQYVGQLYNIRLQQGRLEEIADLLIGAAASNPNLPVLQASLAMLLVELRRDDEARDVFERVSGDGFASLPRDHTFAIALCRCGTVAARLRDVASARAVHDFLAPHSGEVIAVGGMLSGAAARILALLDRVIGDFDSAERHLDVAMRLHEALEAPYWVAITQLDRAELLVEIGGRDALVSELASSAEKTAERYEFGALGARAARILERDAT
jgi:hypothetical protein